MNKYLYSLCFHIEDAMLESGYCVDERDLSENDIKGEDEDNRFEAFERMISTHSQFYNKEWQYITDLEIEEKIVCSFTYNRYLPNNFCKSLSWLNKAIQQYCDSGTSQKDLQNSLSEIKLLDCCRNHSWEKMSETTIIHAQCYYMLHFHKRISYCEAIIREIIKILNISTIESYDNIIRSYKERFRIMQLDCNHSFLTLKLEDDIDSLKSNLLYYAEKIVLEIEFILGELNSCLRYSIWGFDVIKQDSLKETMLYYKRRIIIEKRKYEIEHKEIAVTLTEIKAEKSVAIDQDEKEMILNTVYPAFKNRQKGKNMLEDIDDHYLISSTLKFKKEKLGIIIYLIYCSKLFDLNSSFEIFKQKICAYYGKEDISIKPNKIRNKAVEEYYRKEYLYSKYDIDKHRLNGGK